MKTLITSDWHFSDKARDAYRWHFLKWLRKTIITHNIDRVIMLGDLTEAKDNHGAWLVNRVTDAIAELASLCNVIGIRGNHDGISPDHPFFGYFQHLPHVKWITFPTRIDNELFLPHSSNPQRDWKELGDEYTQTRVHYCHQTFVGAVADNASGFKLKGGVPIDIIPPRVSVYSGDVHRPQQIGPVIQVGAPYRVDFGDDYEPRVIVLDGGAHAHSVRSIPVPGPQKRLIKLTPTTKLTPDLAGPGDIVKIEVELTTEDYSHWLEYRDRIERFATNQKWKVHGIHALIEHVLKTLPKSKQSNQATDAELMHMFAKRQGLDEALLNTGMEFINGM